jgi:hypothetical protein
LRGGKLRILSVHADIAVVDYSYDDEFELQKLFNKADFPYLESLEVPEFHDDMVAQPKYIQPLSP